MTAKTIRRLSRVGRRSERVASDECGAADSESRDKDTLATAHLMVARDLQATFIRGHGRNKHVLQALDHVNMHIDAGETLGVVGESGSGKSTLARVLLRLIEPTGGSVLFEGTDLLKLGPRQMREARRHIQMVFQDPYASLHPLQTAAQIISEPWKVHRGMLNRREHASRVVELLEQVGLSARYSGMYPGQMSGGQRQRIAIARALASRPAVLILDEPVSALDVSIQAQVIKLLKELQQELNLAYVFISHDLALVRLVADRVAVMNKGQFVETGSADEVYRNPRHSYTKELLAASPARVREEIVGSPTDLLT